MDELAGHSGIKRMGDWGGVVQYGGGDPSMVVMFFLKAVSNPAKSDAAGRPFFDDKTFVRIHPPGERLNIIEREATDGDKRRFPMQWMQFKDNAPQVSDGTPIDLLFPSSPATSAALKASGVHTVEQCSALSAHAIETIGMGAQQWVNSAQRYMEVANKGVKASQLRADLDQRDREIHSLKHQVDLLKTELAHLHEAQGQAVTMADVQQLMAQGGGNGRRPQFVPGRLPQSFDAQTAQINGTHPTRDIKKKVAPKVAPKAAAKAAPAPAKRVRARVT